MRPQADDSAFFPFRVELASGVEVEVPPFTLRKDERVRHLIRRALSRDEVGLSVSILGGQSLITLIGFSLSNSTEELIKIGSLILDRPEEWVEDNSAVSDLVGLVRSFILTPVTETDPERVKREGDVWTLARLIDFLAQEYSWTVDDILDRTRWELKAVLEAATQRHEEQRQAMEESSSGRGRSNKVRTATGRKSAVQPGRPKNITPEENEASLQGLRMFARSRGVYEEVKGGDGS